MHIRFHLLVFCLAAAFARAAPKIVCDAPVFDAGERRIGTKVSHTFLVRNAGDQPLRITEVKPGCGCTTATPSRSELLPGETAEIAATLDLTMRRGKQNKPVHVKSNDPAQPDLVLSVVVDSRDDFALEPAYIDLGSVSTGVETRREAVLRVTSEQPYRITALEPVKNVVKASWTSSPDNRVHTITVVVPPQSAAGTFYDNVQIRTDNKDSPTLPLQVVGTIQAALSLSAQEIEVSPSGAPVTRTVAVRAGSAKGFTIASATVDDPDATVEVLPATVFGQQVRVKFASVGPAQNGRTLVIRTSVPGFEEIRVPVKLTAATPAP